MNSKTLLLILMITNTLYCPYWPAKLDKQIKAEKTEYLLILIKFHSYKEISDSDGNTLLHKAVLLEKTELLRFLLSCEQVRDHIDKANNQGFTALHTAVHYARSALVLYLVHHGASVNTCDSLSNTPLHTASQLAKTHINRKLDDKNKETIEVLLRAGAHIFILNKNGTTPFQSLSYKSPAITFLYALFGDLNALTEYLKEKLPPIITPAGYEQNVIARSYTLLQSTPPSRENFLFLATHPLTFTLQPLLEQYRSVIISLDIIKILRVLTSIIHREKLLIAYLPEIKIDIYRLQVLYAQALSVAHTTEHFLEALKQGELSIAIDIILLANTLFSLTLADIKLAHEHLEKNKPDDSSLLINYYKILLDIVEKRRALLVQNPSNLVYPLPIQYSLAPSPILYAPSYHPHSFIHQNK